MSNTNSNMVFNDFSGYEYKDLGSLPFPAWQSRYDDKVESLWRVRTQMGTMGDSYVRQFHASLWQPAVWVEGGTFGDTSLVLKFSTFNLATLSAKTHHFDIYVRCTQPMPNPARDTIRFRLFSNGLVVHVLDSTGSIVLNSGDIPYSLPAGSSRLLKINVTGNASQEESDLAVRFKLWSGHLQEPSEWLYEGFPGPGNFIDINEGYVGFEMKRRSYFQWGMLRWQGNFNIISFGISSEDIDSKPFTDDVVKGTLRDTEGNPVPSRRIRLHHSGSAISGWGSPSANTDVNGNFQMTPIQPGLNWRISIRTVNPREDTDVREFQTVGGEVLEFDLVLREVDFTPLSVGSGTEEDPYLISSAEELDTIRYYLDQENLYFKQVQNIDLSGWEWEPLWCDSHIFKHSYDGNRKKISNLTITKMVNNPSLFGFVDGNYVHSIKNLTLDSPLIISYGYSGGSLAYYLDHVEIENIHVTNLDFHNVSYRRRLDVGGIGAYFFNSKVKNCTVQGEIRGSMGYGGGLFGSFMGSAEYCTVDVNIYVDDNSSEVGGLFGFLQVYEEYEYVYRCSSHGIITWDDEPSDWFWCAGGLWGLCFGYYRSGGVRECYSTMDIVLQYDHTLRSSGSTGLQAGRSSSIGGLGGSLYDAFIVENCYSIGRVEGDWLVGGLFGDVDVRAWGGDPPEDARWSVINCYRVGPVRHGDGEFVHAVAGEIHYKTASSFNPFYNCYYDSDTSEIGDPEAGIARTTVQMTYPPSADTYVDWDFDEVWTHDQDYSKNSGYPFFEWKVDMGDDTELEWERHGIWLDEDMPNISRITSKFFGRRESQVFDLSLVSPYLRELRTVWVDWSEDLPFGSELEVSLTADGGKSWTVVDRNQVFQINMPFEDIQFQTRQFLRVPVEKMFLPVTPKLYSITLYLSSLEGDFEDIWNSFETESKIVVPGSFFRLFVENKDWKGRYRDLENMTVTIYNNKKNVLLERSY